MITCSNFLKKRNQKQSERTFFICEFLKFKGDYNYHSFGTERAN